MFKPRKTRNSLEEIRAVEFRILRRVTHTNGHGRIHAAQFSRGEVWFLARRLLNFGARTKGKERGFRSININHWANSSCSSSSPLSFIGCRCWLRILLFSVSLFALSSVLSFSTSSSCSLENPCVHFASLQRYARLLSRCVREMKARKENCSLHACNAADFSITDTQGEDLLYMNPF